MQTTQLVDTVREDITELKNDVSSLKKEMRVSIYIVVVTVGFLSFYVLLHPCIPRYALIFLLESLSGNTPSIQLNHAYTLLTRLVYFLVRC